MFVSTLGTSSSTETFVPIQLSRTVVVLVPRDDKKQNTLGTQMVCWEVSAVSDADFI